jgi:hypothetical protein
MDVNPGSGHASPRRSLTILLAAGAICSCKPQSPAGGAGAAAAANHERELADAVYAVMSADREIYTERVVNRLQNEEKVLKASEHWKEDKLLPLPAQMFRMGAEKVRQKTKRFSYALLSTTPINKQNAPRTEAEKAGLAAIADGTTPSSYADEALGGAQYLTAVYPDKATSEACVSCHNNHADSPRRDFKLGDVMGGVVIRVARLQ